MLQHILGWVVLPNRPVSRVDQGGLDAIAGRQTLLQQRGELLRELLPVLLADLVLEAMQDLRRDHTNMQQSARPNSLSWQVQFEIQFIRFILNLASN